VKYLLACHITAQFSFCPLPKACQGGCAAQPLAFSERAGAGVARLVDELEDQLSCLVVGASRLIYARVAFLRPLVLSEGGINCVDEVLVALGVICVVKLLED